MLITVAHIDIPDAHLLVDIQLQIGRQFYRAWVGTVKDAPGWPVDRWGDSVVGLSARGPTMEEAMARLAEEAHRKIPNR